METTEFSKTSVSKNLTPGKYPKESNLDALILQINFGMKLYMYQTVPSSIIRSSITVHSAMVYVIQVYRQLSCQNQFVKLVHLVGFIIKESYAHM
jgi:hypothetical protein